jgi:hypothetical protein
MNGVRLSLSGLCGYLARVRSQRRRGSLRNKFLAVLFVLCLLVFVSGLMSIRSTPEQTGTGTINRRTFVAAHTETRSGRVGRGGSGAERVINYGDALHFEVAVDGLHEPVTGSVPAVANELDVGQRVIVVYQEAGFWPFWRHNVLVALSAAP